MSEEREDRGSAPESGDRDDRALRKADAEHTEDHRASDAPTAPPEGAAEDDDEHGVPPHE